MLHAPMRMRHLLAVLILVAAAVHPLLHADALQLAHHSQLDSGSSSRECPCLHGAVVGVAPPRLAAALPREHSHPAVPPAPFVAHSAANDLPPRAPPAAA